jgi:hypothetical protein
MLNPRTQLGKQPHGLLALATGAVTQPGDFEEAIEVVDSGHEFGDRVVVVLGAAKWDEFVVLCQYQYKCALAVVLIHLL